MFFLCLKSQSISSKAAQLYIVFSVITLVKLKEMQKFGPIIRYHPYMENSKFVAMRNVLWPVTVFLDNIDMCPQS
jgi:hypothetical protein